MYRVIQVVSKFENGKFTQDLDCVIDNEIDLRNFIKEIESVMQTPDIPATVEDLTNPIPETNIRNSRLIGDGATDLEGAANNIRQQSGPAASALNSNLGTVPGISSLLPGSASSGINSRRIF